MEMSLKEMGAYLKKLREIKGLSTREVYELSNVSNSYLSLVENGHRRASAVVLKKLAPVYGVDYLDLYVKAGYADLAESEKIKEKENKILNKKYYMCPVYGQISAGQPNWAEENIEGYLPIDPDLMRIVNPEEHFFLRVNGESMNNVVKNGAFALIHKQDMVEDGEIAVVLVNGYDATLKRFTKKGDVVVLEPDSTDSSFKTQIYDKTTPIKILGKYVGKMEINN